MQYTLKKSLGQHFLKDDTYCLKIQEVLLQQEIDQLLEVGPGGGALTQFIYTIPKNEFKAIELDTEKVNYLNFQYPELAGKIINADFLHMEMPFEKEFVVVGNFPYNISTQIVFKVLDWYVSKGSSGKNCRKATFKSLWHIECINPGFL